ncbi:MAG: hypothetical protein APF80_02320 [Alphaproteobacteria bacterium BRH_c36]|nr:MAG: hypothetical protein APF80_02320 [Alphaproteobacteria bacterium BRH_c36]
MTETASDDREALKARFSQFTNARVMPPPIPAENQPRSFETDSLSPNEPVMRKGLDQVKLKIRRSQAKGLVRGVAFNIHFIAELSPDAQRAVEHYRFGKTVLYHKPLELQLSLNAVVALWRMFWLWITRSRWQITVNDLMKGRTVKCNNILEVLDVEKDIRAAAEIFADILRAASWFGGEEVVEL